MISTHPTPSDLRAIADDLRVNGHFVYAEMLYSTADRLEALELRAEHNELRTACRRLVGAFGSLRLIDSLTLSGLPEIYQELLTIQGILRKEQL